MGFLPLPWHSSLKNICFLSLILIIIGPYAYHKSYQKIIEIKAFAGENISLLVIPRIAFTKPFFPNDNEKNNLTTGIMSIKNNNHLLLASHSGEGIHSYFKKLEELKIGDEFFIKENNQERKYQIIAVNYKDKDGKLSYQSKEDNLVILITCSKKVLNKQVYFVGKKV